jgi:uncharacterized protein involved in exopolysaccharide biosynthesis
MAEKLFATEKNQDQSLEISIADIINFLRRYFLMIICGVFVFAVIGYAISYAYDREYTSQTILLPEQGVSSGGFFASLSMGGMSADKIGAIRTDLYPNVLESIPFALHLLKLPVVDKDNKKYPTLHNFLETHKEESLLSKFFSGSKKVAEQKSLDLPNDKILALSGEEMGDAGRILTLVKTSIDAKTGVITIQAEMKDPVVAAVVVDAASTYLMNYVADYRTGKTAKDVDFLEKRVAEAKRRQQAAEYALQSYRDRNRNAFLNTARIEEQRLQAEYTLAQSVYGDLVSRLEQAKIKVQEDQPIFKVLEPAKIPLGSSKPKRLVSAIGFAVLGGILILSYILFVREKVQRRFFANS